MLPRECACACPATQRATSSVRASCCGCWTGWCTCATCHPTTRTTASPALGCRCGKAVCAGLGSGVPHATLLHTATGSRQHRGVSGWLPCANCATPACVSPGSQTKVLRTLQYFPLPEGPAAQKQLHDSLLAIFNCECCSLVLSSQPGIDTARMHAHAGGIACKHSVSCVHVPHACVRHTQRVARVPRARP
jgi:hypothetical protein